MYKINNDFFVRYPSQPIDLYINYSNIDFNKELDNICKEMILTSSNSLYNSIFVDKNCKNKREKIEKYLIRSCSRTTPFGLLAGVQQGRISSIENLNSNENYRKKRVRPDMEWLIPVIRKLEQLLVQDISVICNNVNKISSVSICKEWNTCYMMNENQVSKKLIVDNTPVMKLIIDSCYNQYVSTDLIYNKLLEKYPNLTRDYFDKFLLNLIDKEFILSNLRISNIDYRPFDTLIDKVKGYKEKNILIEQLLNINHLLKEYEKIPIGEGIQKYIEIIQEMKKISNAEKFLHIDMFSEEQLFISKEKTNILEEFVDFMFKWSYKENYNDYISRFQEKYGNQAVQYLDVINPDIGLGYPKSSDTGKIAYNDMFWESFIDLAMKAKEKEAIDISDLKNNNYLDNKYLPHSIELSSYLLKDKKDYQFYISPIVGTAYGYRTRGRFEYLFDNQAIEEGTVELSFVPTGMRYTNVMFCNSRSEYYLEYGSSTHVEGNKKINLEDIYMYIDENQKISFVLKDSKKPIRFIISNMLNKKAYPKEIQYLYEIQNNQDYFILSLYSSLMHFVHHCGVSLPRITYKNIILFPRTWKLDIDAKENNFKNYCLLLSKFREKYKVSKTISYGQDDKRILIDLDNISHLKILYEFSKKNRNVILFENLFSIENSSIIGEKGSYVGEFIFNFYKENNDKTSSIDKKYYPCVDNKYIISHSNTLFDKWISLKLYIEEWQSENILINNIKNFLYKILLFDNVENAFYVRYKDPQSHIRVRIKIKKYDENIVEEIKKILKKLKNLGILNNCVCDTYIPEINRYGGEKCIEKVEDVFCSNSLMNLNLLESNRNHDYNFDLESLYIISSYKILLNMGLDDELILKFLNNYNYGKRSNKEFKVINSKIGYLLNGESGIQRLEDMKNGMKLLTIFDFDSKVYRIYFDSLKENNNITNQYQAITSILHMHFNRLIGINRGLEFKLTSYLRKIIFINAKKRLYYEKK